MECLGGSGDRGTLVDQVVERLSQARSAKVFEIGDDVELFTEGKELGKGIDITIPCIKDETPGGVVMEIVAVHVCKHNKLTRG